MAKTKLTKERQQELFDNNFSQEAYEQAKQLVQSAISNAASFPMLWMTLQKYDRDIEYDDDSTIIYCEIELDKSLMRTKADYVGVRFTILWYDDFPERSGIIVVELYSSDTPNGEVEPMCYFDPNTLEIIIWNRYFHINKISDNH